jgi:hypothetical protein
MGGEELLDCSSYVDVSCLLLGKLHFGFNRRSEKKRSSSTTELRKAACEQS